MKSKANKKGSTLVEILVAISIFAIFSLVISSMFSAISKSTKDNKKANEEIASQTKKAEAGNIAGETAEDDSFVLKFEGESKEFTIDIKKYTIKEDDDTFNMRIFE